MQILNEKTLVPISLLAVIAGGVFWLSSMHNLSIANAADIQEVKTDIRQDLKRIEHKIDRLEDRLNK